MMIALGKIERAIVHQVGNKTNGDGVRFSSQESSLEKVESDIDHLLKKVFLFEDTYQFYFEPTLTLNPVYTFIKAIFENSNNFVEESQNISRYLYEKSTHPKIKGGEVCFVYLKDCEVDGVEADAICILKSETKETILQFQPLENGYEVLRQQGLSLQKLDKGCVIFNIEGQNGYKLSVVDGTKKGDEAKYWIESFLHIRPSQNSYHKTKAVVEMFTNYVANEMPLSFDKTKSEQALMINRGLKELKSKSEGKLKEISEKVFTEHEIQKDFHRYSENYQVENKLLLDDSFEISKSAMKKKGLGALTTIKLDKNFDIQIHGGDKYIERGYDNDLKMNYYKLYFNQEKNK